MLKALKALLPSQSALAVPSADRRLANVLVLLLANLLRAGLGLATSAIIFRAVGPQDMGRMTIVLSTIGLLSIVGEFGMRDAAVNYIARFLQDEPDKADSVGRTFLISKTFLSTVATGVALSVAGLVATRFYPQAQVESLIRLAAFSLLADGLLGYSLVILEAHQNFRVISLLSAIQSLLRFGLILTLFLVAKVNLVSLLVLETVIPLVAFIYSLRYISPAYLVWRRPFLAFLGQLFHMSKWIAVAALASLLASRLDVLFLGYYQAPAMVGTYAAALALVNKIDLIKVPILTTAFPDACRRTRPSDLCGYVRQNLKLTLSISLALLPLLFASGFIIRWLYGIEYVSAAPACNLLLVAYLIGLNAEPAAFVLYPLNKPAWVAGKEFMPLVVFVALGSVLIPRFGLLGAAWSVLLRRLAEALLTSLLVWRYLYRPHTLDHAAAKHL